ncbi:hypothetical protein N7528_006634 [Penicillium herquei]|nr:hypothetical protein N7528_006634 [Penicillium herquei]
MPDDCPFSTNPLKYLGELHEKDTLPASYPGPHDLSVPSNDVEGFLVKDLSLGKLNDLKHLWFAGAVRRAIPLHEQIVIGRDIVITERMGLHLLWKNDRRLFIKPLPCYLLQPSFWRKYLCCKSDCECKPQTRATSRNHNSTGDHVPALGECPEKKLWEYAMGFLYSYVCLISYESDFSIASEKYLLPRQLIKSKSGWEDWKRLVQEVLSNDDRKTVHPRFLRAELRLARLDTIHRLTQMPPFEPYLRQYWNYGSLFRENITLLTTATIFIALVLTAMQVGLATEQLGQNKSFTAASYGFTIFAILGPICAFGLVMVDALWHFMKDLPQLLGLSKKRNMEILSGENETIA